jgi:hypothetical protein
MLLLAGCGDGLPETAPVTGKVTYQGKVVSEGKIGFYPSQGVPAFGQIQSDGHFTLSTFKPGDGAIPGHHTVTIEAMRIVTAEPPPETFADEIARATKPQQRRPPPLPKVEWLVPQSYSREATSGLSAEVKPNEENRCDFPL